MKEVTVFCPASVANISCGFDHMGFALHHGEEMVIRKTNQPGVVIEDITGYSLPMVPDKNVAAVAAMAFLKGLKTTDGVAITIHKKIHPGSGIGSSSASASGVIYGLSKLFDNDYSQEQLVEFAMEGEYVASKSLHADNVGPALLGGMVFIKGYEPLDLFKIPVPPQLVTTIVSPQVEVRTVDARKVLRQKVGFQEALTQCGNLGGLIAGMYRSDYELIGRSLIDVLVEPQRSHLIPFFHDIREAGMNAGALGVGISGSGPSVFAFSKGEENAEKVKESFDKVFYGKSIDHISFVSKINEEGPRLL